MEPATPFDWHRIFIGDEPALFYLEIVFRVVVVYTYAVLLVRLMGKRGSQALSPLESIVIIALGSAVGDAMFYPEVPLTYAFVVVTVIVALSRAMAMWQVRSEDFNDFMDGRPLLVVRNGVLLEKAVREARLREDEMLALLRLRGIEDLARVRLAWLERTGELSVFQYDTPLRAQAHRPTSPTHAEVIV